jgi:TolA-binding protein
MTMTKLKLGIIGAVAAVAVTTPLVLQHQALERSREEALALREQVGAQKAENERLTGLLARQGNSQSENERMSELLRLRSAVTELRKQTNELAALKEQNRQLQAALQQIPSTTDSAQVSPQRSDFPREQWAYAGYETPEAAALTMAWAAANGDVGVITNSTTPELQQMLDFLVRQGRFETEFLAGMKADVQGMSEFRIAKREVLTNDLIKLTVSIPGKNDRHPILKKIGNEWKFVRFN